MIVKRCMAAAATSILVLGTLPALATEDALTVRSLSVGTVEDGDIESALPSPAQTLSLGALESSAFAERGLHVEFNRVVMLQGSSLHHPMSASQTEVLQTPPDIMIVERAGSYPTYDSAPPPTVIGYLEVRHAPFAPAVATTAGQTDSEGPRCTAADEQFAVVAYLTDEQLENDPRVPRLLTAIQSLVAQANVERSDDKLVSIWPSYLNTGAINKMGGSLYWSKNFHLVLENKIIEYEQFHPVQWGDSLASWSDFPRKSVKPICISRWAFFPQSRPQWTLYQPRKLTVSIESDGSFGSSHFYRAVLNRLYGAIASGLFAANGLIIDVDSGFGASGLPVETIQALQWISNEKFIQFGPNFVPLSRPVLDFEDDASLPDVVISIRDPRLGSGSPPTCAVWENYREVTSVERSALLPLLGRDLGLTYSICMTKELADEQTDAFISALSFMLQYNIHSVKRWLVEGKLNLDDPGNWYVN